MEKAPTKPKINIKLLMYNDAITAQTRTGCSVISCGLGRIPYMISAPNNTAVVPDPGLPRVNNGTKCSAFR